MAPRLSHQAQRLRRVEEKLEALLAARQAAKIIPRNFIDWCIQMRPVVEGTPNLLQFMPMLRDVYADEHPWQMIVWARQRGKTTRIASRQGFLATTRPRSKTQYVTYEIESMNNYSEVKLREAVFNDNPVLKKFIDSHTLGKITRVKLKNGSFMSQTTHHNKFKHVQGKTLDELEFDEGQDLDLESWVMAREAQSFSKGKFKISGIGGYRGTPYHDLWLTTNQMEWEFDDPDWHDKLQYEYGKGVIYGDYLNDVMRGKWVPKAPDNWMRHGYTLPQSAFPDIPITIAQAQKWGVNPEFSIEYRERDPLYPNSDFVRHVLAGWIEGDVKPILSKHIYALFRKDLRFTPADEVDRNLGPIFLGVDWGGGNKTIVWIMQLIDPINIKFRILWIEQIATSDVDKQKERVEELINAYRPDQSVVDAGGGIYQTQQLQKTFGMSVIRNHFLDRPNVPFPTPQELRRLRRLGMYEEDRNHIIEVIIGLVTNGAFEIPYTEPKRVEWIVDQFTAVEMEFIRKRDMPEQKHYFHADNKPDDAFMSCLYSYLAYWTRNLKHHTTFRVGKLGSK